MTGNEVLTYIEKLDYIFDIESFLKTVPEDLGVFTVEADDTGVIFIQRLFTVGDEQKKEYFPLSQHLLYKAK